MKGFDEIFLTRAANSQWIRVDDLKNRGWTDAMLADFSRKKSVRSLDFCRRFLASTTEANEEWRRYSFQPPESF